jgi:hypothetical protein
MVDGQRNSSSVSLQLSLQMAHARPLCRFGLVYTGHTFITAELSKIKLFLLPPSLYPDAALRQAAFRTMRRLDSDVIAVLSF